MEFDILNTLLIVACLVGNSSKSCLNLSQNSLQIHWCFLLLKDSNDLIFLNNLKFSFLVIDWHRLSSSTSLRDIPLNCSSILLTSGNWNLNPSIISLHSFLILFRSACLYSFFIIEWLNPFILVIDPLQAFSPDRAGLL